jgi:two-component system response regulator GlrR
MTQKDVITEDYVLQTRLLASDSSKGPLGAGRAADAEEPPKSLKDARDAFERDYLVQLLSITEGNVSQAAKLAGKYRADLYDLLKKHDLKVDDFKKPKTTPSNYQGQPTKSE